MRVDVSFSLQEVAESLQNVGIELVPQMDPGSVHLIDDGGNVQTLKRDETLFDWEEPVSDEKT